MGKGEQEKLRRKEQENNPMGNFSDSVNRSMLGDPVALLSGGCLTRIFTVVINILGIIVLSQCYK
ncbi:hypothetical protein IM538_13215 [Cytobacillus suaedae]|nr:hypothetical protein IM538_13215 [Cytobacillus suaedae]